MKRMQNQMDTLEAKVAKECKEGMCYRGNGLRCIVSSVFVYYVCHVPGAHSKYETFHWNAKSGFEGPLTLSVNDWFGASASIVVSYLINCGWNLILEQLTLLIKNS